MTERSHYTFGDTATAELRLELLAELFAPHSRGLLSSLVSASAVTAGEDVIAEPQRVLDVGCGPGFTTALLAEVFPHASVVGIDASERYIAVAATKRSRARVRFVRRDAAAPSFPGAPFDLIYVRFLLTHLADPGAVLHAWREAATPGGVVVAEELASLTSADPLVQRYYEIVAAMQQHYGQRFEIGKQLDAIARSAGWRVERFETRRLDLDVPALLRLHALNVQSWRADPFVRESCRASELDAIERRLEEIAARREPAPPVEYVLGQLIARA